MLITHDSDRCYVRRHAGGKGENLYRLSKAGFPVPRWVVLGEEWFRRFRVDAGLHAQIAELTKRGDLTAVRELIVNASLPQAIEEEIRRAWREVAAPAIAVRSSAVGEDAAGRSFAGQLSSYLYVTSVDDTVQAVKNVWASAYSDRAVSYRAQSGLADEPVDVAVILQAMVDAEKSGVLFTCDPLGGDADRITINAVYGLGEGLVSGLLDADTVVLDKTSGAKIRSEIAVKHTHLVRCRGGSGLEEQTIAAELREVSCLSDAELAQLAALGRKVERFYRFPQDIEWAIQDGDLMLLQARPVTSAVRAYEGLLYIWDNSNIVESYGGITLPLTFTFARHVYHQVYVQFCEVLGVPQHEIRNMDHFLRNMLGSFYGRVYYNILNWYRLTSILPGFKHNRAFMETMMGTPHQLADEIADRIKPPGFQESFSSKVRRFWSGLKFAYYHFTIQRVVDRFLAYFHAQYEPARRVDYDQLPADEIYACYLELENQLLRRWQAPIINDYLCMVHFGLFKHLTARWLGHLGGSLQNDLLCGEGNLESAEPTRAILRMAALAEAEPDLKALLLQVPADDALEALRQSPFTAFLAAVEQYIDHYGFRCMNEMKLEQRDLHQDPAFLFTCLKNYLRSGVADLETHSRREREIRKAAERKVNQELKGWRKLVYRWSLKHARRAVRNRENTRFCRTRIYGVVRAMFYGIGRDYVLRRIIDRPEDIFYLTLQELQGSLEGHLTSQDLRGVVHQRQQEYAAYREIEPAPRFITRGPPYWMNYHFSADGKPVEDSTGVLGDGAGLKGAGCCPGVVEGVAKVILSPDDDLDLNGEILCTLRTDPGWIPLYPSISGLVVERGGLLSHSAIVAREMGLPTVVGVKGLTKTIRSGMRLRINGQTGEVRLLE